MEIRHELIQLGIAASPLLVAILVVRWAPSTQTMRRLKGMLGALLVLLPYWVMLNLYPTH